MKSTAAVKSNSAYSCVGSPKLTVFDGTLASMPVLIRLRPV